jgi:hypothetical protein
MTAAEKNYVPIKGFSGEYGIDFFGEVYSYQKKSKNNLKGKVLKKYINNFGYCTVGLYKNSKVKRLTIHRLVAETFIPNPENKPQVNHIDGNKLNNHVDNLEWATAKENIQHAWNSGLSKRISEKQKKQTLIAVKSAIEKNKKPVICLQTGVVYKSIKDACEETGIKNICKVCKGLRRTAGGYNWSYYVK